MRKTHAHRRKGAFWAAAGTRTKARASAKRCKHLAHFVNNRTQPQALESAESAWQLETDQKNPHRWSDRHPDVPKRLNDWSPKVYIYSHR
jgi:hypothetical protein